MHRTRSNRARRLVAGLAVTSVLLLAGCSNDTAGDAPAPAPSGPVSAPGSASASTVDTDTANTADTGTPDTADTGTAGSGSSDPESAASGSGEPSSEEPPGTRSTTSVSPSSRSPKPTPSTPEPSGSAAVGDFDEATTTWFDGLCSGLENKPRDEFEGLAGDVDTKKTAAAGLFTEQANTIDGSVATMKKAGPPDIPGGEKFDTAVQQAYPKMAAAARDAATAVGDVTSEDALEQAFTDGRDAVSEAAVPLGAYGEVIGAPAVTVQMQKIPSCQAIVPN